MCLAVPGLIQSIVETETGRMAKILFGGIVKEISLDLVPEAAVGDYVIVHVGFALNILDKDEAEQTLAMFAQLGHPATLQGGLNEVFG